MKLLLDTHVLLFWLDTPARLSKKVRALIAEREHEVLVSAASALEITTKFRLGRLPQAGPLISDFTGWMQRAGFSELPISHRHAHRAGLFAAPHHDPFDRLLAAQSIEDSLPIASTDEALDLFGVQRIW
jgi:PIN domain nuclease of toxin-antitoxin system